MSQPLRKTFLTAGASYFGMISTMACGLITLRLATQHLSAEELGIWNFVFATVSYFALLEFGLGPGIARLLGDPLASGDQKKANELFTTGLLLLGFQGALFLVLGWFFREPLLAWGRVPDGLFHSTAILWTGVVLIRSLTLPVVLLNGILWAQNRVYWIHSTSALWPWAGLGVFAWALSHGNGLLAYLWSLTIPAVLSVISIVIAVLLGPHRFRLVRKGFHFGVVREIFGYSWSVFAASGAAQLSTLSQMIIVTRVCGLETAGIFAVTARVPSLLMGIITKPFDSFIPRWSANFCKSGVDAVRNEFLLILRCSILGTAAAGIAVCVVNPAFVRFWTKPELFGGPLLNTGLAVLLIYQMISRAFSYAFTMRKQMTGFAMASLASVGLEIGMQVLGAKIIGPAGVIYGYLAAVGMFLLWYILRNGCRMLDVGARQAFLPDLLWWGIPLMAGIVLGASQPWKIGSGTFEGFLVSALFAILIALPIGIRIFLLLRAPMNLLKHTSKPCTLET